MPIFSEANLFGVTIRESANDGSDFTNPDADYRRLFLGEDGQLHVKDSAGTVTSIGSGSSTFSGAHVYNSTTQTASPLLFDTEVFDTDTYHSTSSNTGRLTVPSTGYYQFVFTSLGNTTEVKFQKNGTTVVAGRVYGLSNNYIINVSHPLLLSATHYVEVINGGGSFGHASVFDAQSQFSVFRLGS